MQKIPLWGHRGRMDSAGSLYVAGTTSSYGSYFSVAGRTVRNIAEGAPTARDVIIGVRVCDSFSP